MPPSGACGVGVRAEMMGTHDRHNVLPHADTYKLRWALLLADIENAAQAPPPRPFDHRSTKSSRNYHSVNGKQEANATGDIAYIPWDHIEDFRKGEECRPNVECRFVRKDVCKQQIVLQPQPCSFIKKFKYRTARKVEPILSF